MPAQRTGTGMSPMAIAVMVLSIVVSIVVIGGVVITWYADKTQSCYRFNHIHQYVQCVEQQFR